MSGMENKLIKYYEEASIASVKEEKDSKGYYDYEKMFRSFCCPKKNDCRKACCKEYRPSDNGPKFLFSPRTECAPVSQHYAERQYGNLSIPRIVVVSLSVPKPELKPDCSDAESQPFSLHPDSHWRGTTTTVRSLLDPFVCLAPAEGYRSTEIIDKLFVHVRTGKCFSNAGGPEQEPHQLYKNCGGYLRKEVSILEPDVIVTQGGPAHDMSEKYVFDESAREPPKRVGGIADSIARIVHLREDNRKVYWLRSRFPGGRWCRRGRYPFYSPNHAGPRIDSESHIEGAKLKNLVLYGRDIKKFMDKEER